MTSNISWRLLSFTDEGRTCTGICVGDQVYDLAAVLGLPPGAFMSILDVLRGWPVHQQQLEAFVRRSDVTLTSRRLQDLSLIAPLPAPGTIYCSGANYRDHLAEMYRIRGMEQPSTQIEGEQNPWFFMRPGQSCTGAPFGTTSPPPGCKALDWEAELAVVIGRPARNVSAEDALSYVAGYMVANDLSARDLARRSDKEPGTPFYYDWMAHKAFDGSCPMGPWITVSNEIDPQNLAVRLWVNGVLKQDSNTAEMITSVAEQISYLSRSLCLQPGDVLLTGTPAGVGAGRGEFLNRGDRVRVQVGQLGEIETTIS